MDNLSNKATNWYAAEISPSNYFRQIDPLATLHNLKFGGGQSSVLGIAEVILKAYDVMNGKFFKSTPYGIWILWVIVIPEELSP
ncbi:4016_t:CDS:2 [Funneliformis mosseae]|uniref:4016_t:CDS:1 n=1 Tax=Funneliformis mosseae TaxID=27381 RepID=A0A9N8ZK29_FUNMO|nr:4016_t:CDS:2 [Funneliformis mosseae]